MDEHKIRFVASETSSAQKSMKELTSLYGNVEPSRATVIVALGGDGFMIETLHRYIDHEIPIYGMNQGTVGFLMNAYQTADLPKRLAEAQPANLHPLKMHAECSDGKFIDGLAINEVSLLRESRYAAKIQISVDGRVRLEELICDGVMTATPAGSTAYNLSVHGPILSLDSKKLSISPISAFRPRRWKGIVVSDRTKIIIKNLNTKKRPISAVADNQEFRNAKKVIIKSNNKIKFKLLYDSTRSLQKKIKIEQLRKETS